MIRLGLSRVSQLLKNSSQPWKAVHVAGTNGKGTVCAYLSALLHGNGIKCGRFTSPHLIDRWDCISIDEKPVSKTLFDRAEAKVMQRNENEAIQASPFELLTATAFDIFTEQNVEVAVVEVGMGGRDDATNVMKSKDLTIITRIGLDHQAFLGNTLVDIARHKCGIFAKDVPVIYNASNQNEVLDVIKAEAETVKSGLLTPVNIDDELPGFVGTDWEAFGKTLHARPQQRIAITQAWKAFRYMHRLLRPDEKAQICDAEAQRRNSNIIMNLNWPGRLHLLDVDALVPEMKGKPLLLDGAHNAQAAENLAGVVNAELRGPEGNDPVSWILATTKGRDVRHLLRPLLQRDDEVAAVEFGPVEGMPWVQALPSDGIEGAVLDVCPEAATTSCGRDILAALKWASESENNVVVTGSLYLCSDLLRALRDAGGSIENRSRSGAPEITSPHMVKKTKVLRKKPGRYKDRLAQKTSGELEATESRKEG